MRPRDQAWTPDERQEIKELYEGGLSMKKIAAKFDTNFNRVRRVILRTGIERRVGNRQHTIDEHVFDAIDTPEKAYWLGFVWADGCVSGRALWIGLQASDGLHLEGLAHLLSSDTPVRYKCYEYEGFAPSHRAIFNVSGVHLSDRLKELGILKGRPDHNLMLSQIPGNLFGSWLHGFFDGDGCATPDRRIQFCGSLLLLEALRAKLHESVGTSPDLGIYKNCQSDYYSICYKGYHNAHKVSDLMYKDAVACLERKKSIVDAWLKPDRHRQAKLSWVSRKQAHSAETLDKIVQGGWNTRRQRYGPKGLTLQGIEGLRRNLAKLQEKKKAAPQQCPLFDIHP